MHSEALLLFNYFTYVRDDGRLEVRVYILSLCGGDVSSRRENTGTGPG